MNAIDKRIEELNDYHPDSTAPEDLELFWERTKAEAIETNFASERVEEKLIMPAMKAYSVSYEGFGNTMIHARLMLPKEAAADSPCPCLVSFPGYTSDQGTPENFAHWILMGVGILSLDVRGQGGKTGNRLGSSHGMTKGWMTEGLLDLEQCYYKAIAVDALRAVTWAENQPEIDSNRIGAIGASQGGGLALLSTALHDTICLTVADIPSLCHMDYGVLHSTGSLSEIAAFCRKHPDQMELVLHHLSYFDIYNLASKIQVPLLASVGLKDTICMPEQIFPAFNAIASANKSLEIYPFTGHAVESAQKRKAIDFVYKNLCSS